MPTPSAQCLGDYEYEYVILPHKGDWRQVYQLAYNYTAPLMAVRPATHAGLELHEMNITRDNPANVTKAEWPRGGSLPDSFSFVSVESPELVLSTVYRSNDSLIVRVYNVTRSPVSSQISFGVPVQKVALTNMNEEVIAALQVQDNHYISVDVREGEILTLNAALV